MNIRNFPSEQKCAQQEPVKRIFRMPSLRLCVRLGAVLVLAGLLVTSFYVASSASVSKKVSLRRSPTAVSSSRVAKSYFKLAGAGILPRSGAIGSWRLMPLTPPLPPPGESIATFDVVGGVCTATPKNSFNLGDTVCAVITGASLGADGRVGSLVGWVSPYESLVQGGDITTDPQTALYTIPLTATQTFTDAGGGTVTVDNRGVWNVGVYSASDGSFHEAASFTVHDPAKAYVDLSVHQASSIVQSEVGAGSSGSFELFVTNKGPNAAINVVLSDTIPSNTTFTSAIEEAGGPGFTCGTPTAGVFTCTVASLAANATAHITFNYSVNNGTTAGTELINLAGASSDDTPCSPDTCDIQPNDNSSTSSAVVPTDTGTPTCTLDCPDNITVTANTSQGGNAGAFVTYSAAQPQGSCGAVSNTPASGSFFTVGTTIVTSSATTGDSCTFQVTVNPPDTVPPTITCPANKTATAPSGSSEATVDPGTPTTNPASGVTVAGTRSDGLSLTDPYPVGLTLITWTVTNSTSQSASCTQRITVNSSDCGNDTVPPTITAPPAVTAHTGPGSTTCGVALSPSDDELGSPVANDNCSVTVTSDIPPGGLFPVGTTTVHYTATDGAGNTATATQVVTVIDNTPPQISAPAAASYTCPNDVPAGNPSQAHGTDPNQPDGGPPTDNCGAPTVTVSDTSSGAGSAASPRIITRTFTATDSHGNTASAVQTITVTDSTPPTITAPANVSANTGAGATSCDTVVNPGTASASDNCAGVTVSRSPAGNTFPVGTTTVTWTATDWAGNTATATQTVTVVDNTPPVLTAPAAVTAYTGPGATSCGTVVSNATLGSASASDNCPGIGAITRTGVPSGNAFPVGSTTINYSVTDAHGNSTSRTQVVTVIDNTPPTISCQADIVADFNAAVNGAVVTFTAPVGTDNCASNTAQIAGLPSGSTFPTGTTTNTFRVTDASGNTAQCSFKVTVALTSLIGLDSVTISGSGYADSYSSAGGYPASKSSLANILSNGTITIGGSGKVWGNVRSTRTNVNMTGSAQVTGNATAGTTVTTSGSATVLGTRTNNALAPVMTLPGVAACSPFSSGSGITGTYTYSAGTGDLTLSGVNIATLANGNYCFHNITLGNSTQLKVNGPVVIKMTGTLNTSGASNLNNTTQIPSNLQILSSYNGSNGVTIGNSVSVYALIYSPNTGLNLSGAAPLFGTFAGKAITIGNSGAIHYDTQLKAIWPAVWALLP